MYARRATEYTTDLITKPPKPASLSTNIKQAFFACFDKQVLREGLNPHKFAIRNTISIVTCYYVGFYYLKMSAVASGTASLLITNFTGSAIQKNLGRLMAVVIGNILPHIFTTILGSSCGTTTIIGQAALILSFETLANYIYYSSSAYGYIGCLCAAFATSNLIYPCVDLTPDKAAFVDQQFQLGSYGKIVETTVAVLMMTIVDSLLAKERASDGAINNLNKGLICLDTGFQAVFAPRRQDGSFSKREIVPQYDIKVGEAGFARKMVAQMHKGPATRVPGTIINFLNQAEALAEESTKEPRYHRVPWPAEFFNNIIRISYVLRAYLNMVEQVQKGSDGKYADIWGQFRKSEYLDKVRKDLCSEFTDAINLVAGTLQNDTGKPNTHLEDRIVRMETAGKIEEMADLMDEINKSGLHWPEGELDSLEDDLLCRLNVVLMLLESLGEQVCAMAKECIKYTA